MWKTSREYFIISSYRRAIEQEKTIYKESFDKLKVLKPEIEHIRKVCGTIVYMWNKIRQFCSSSFRFLNAVEKLSNSSLINGTELYILEAQKSYLNSKKKPSLQHQFTLTIRSRVMSTTTSLRSTKQRKNYCDADISHSCPNRSWSPRNCSNQTMRASDQVILIWKNRTGSHPTCERLFRTSQHSVVWTFRRASGLGCCFLHYQLCYQKWRVHLYFLSNRAKRNHSFFGVKISQHVPNLRIAFFAQPN